MPYELRNADILMISLVKDPATGRQVIFKSRDGQPDFGRTVQFAKADDEKQIVYGIAYPAGSPEKTDAHGDFATPAEVAAMAARFMRNARTVAGVDRDHDYRAMKGVTVVESWIVRQGDPLFGNPEDVGAWAVGVHIEDKSLYDEFKKTGYRGFSIAGVAERHEVTTEKSSGPEGPSLGERIAKIFSKTKETDMGEEQAKGIEKIAEQMAKNEEAAAKRHEDLMKALAKSEPEGNEADEVEASGTEKSGGKGKATEKTKAETALTKDAQIAELIKAHEIMKANGLPVDEEALTKSIQAVLLKSDEPEGSEDGERIAKLEKELAELKKAKPGSSLPDANGGEGGSDEVAKSNGKAIGGIC